MDLNKIEKFIRAQQVGFVCSIDDNGFPNAKAMLKPRKRLRLNKRIRERMVV